MNRNLEELYSDLNLSVRKIIKNELVPKGKNSGCDMIQHGYHNIYDNYLKPYRNKTINLCEIGILCGDKLVIFNEYFKDATLYGYDINIDIIKKYQPIEFLNKIHIKKVDSKKKKETDLIKEKFDILIDDGCHLPASIISTFNNFYDKINVGGIYVIEDISSQRLKIVSAFLNDSNIKFKYEINPILSDCGIIIIQKKSS